MSDKSVAEVIASQIPGPEGLNNITKYLFEDATIAQFVQSQLVGVVGKAVAVTRKRPEFSSSAVDDEGFVTAVADSLKEYQRAFLSAIQEMQDDRAKLLERINRVSQQNVKRPDTIASSISQFGIFNAAGRRPGEMSGMAAGRVPVLKWNELPLNSSKIPASVRSAIAKVKPGLLQGLECAELPFLPGGTLWHFWFPAEAAHLATDADAFVIVFEGSTDSEPYILDWTNEPFYRLAEQKKFRFSKDSDLYIRCFFHLVRGTLGRFSIIENERDLEERVPWRRDIDDWEGAKSAAKDKIRPFLAPMTRKSFNASGGVVYRACVLFKNALFLTDIVLNSSGQVELANETLKLEDLPMNAPDGLGRPDDDKPTGNLSADGS